MLVAIGARVAMPRIADAIARRMAAVASWSRVAAAVAPVEADPADDSIGTSSSVASAGARAANVPSPRVGARRAAGSRGIVISEDRVLHLTSQQLRRIHWTTLVDAHGRPAGVSLSGVGTLGVGLTDGDVVTTIGGRPTPMEDDATDAALAAWSSGPCAVHATIIRGGETIAVTVEIPRVDAGIRVPTGSTKAGSGGM